MTKGEATLPQMHAVGHEEMLDFIFLDLIWGLNVYMSIKVSYSIGPVINWPLSRDTPQQD